MSSLPTTQTAGRPSASLHYAVGEISGKLDQLMVSLSSRFTDLEQSDAALKASIVALEARVGTLDQFRWAFLGVISVGGFLMGAWEILPKVILLIPALGS